MEEVQKLFLAEQKNEITQSEIYKKISGLNKENKSVLQTLSKDELNHYNFWKKYTKRDVKPDRFKVMRNLFLAKTFGLTFTLKKLERDEKKIKERQKKLIKFSPEIKKIVSDDELHEKKIMKMINEERLKYTSSTILGLNDALVEITGVLAGLTFTGRGNFIALTGLITGIAAALSMSASGYLSAKEEKGKNALKSAVYTGIAYIITVMFLVLPYFLFSHVYISLAVTLCVVVTAVFLFNYYVSIAKEVPFAGRFWRMIIISMSVTAITFGIGFLVQKYIGIQV